MLARADLRAGAGRGRDDAGAPARTLTDSTPPPLRVGTRALQACCIGCGSLVRENAARRSTPYGGLGPVGRSATAELSWRESSGVRSPRSLTNSSRGKDRAVKSYEAAPESTVRRDSRPDPLRCPISRVRAGSWNS